MTDESDFLAAILAQPDSNTERLVYADWLDEQGPVSVPCPKCAGAGGFPSN